MVTELKNGICGHRKSPPSSEGFHEILVAADTNIHHLELNCAKRVKYNQGEFLLLTEEDSCFQM